MQTTQALISHKYKRKLIPERFIIICPNGHIDDFPVAEWLHADCGHAYDPIEKGGKCKIRRSTGGASASLSGIFYECTCGAKKSIASAKYAGALGKIGYHCRGTKPWLGIDEDEENPCPSKPEDLQIVLRGATNVWFADTRSSIYIPTDDDQTNKRIVAILDRHYDDLNASRIDGEWNRSIPHRKTKQSVNKAYHSSETTSGSFSGITAPRVVNREKKSSSSIVSGVYSIPQFAIFRLSIV